MLHLQAGFYNMDKKEGYGEFLWPDGRMYKGQWKNGKQEGDGIFIAPDGQQRSGVWKEGNKIDWKD